MATTPTDLNFGFTTGDVLLVSGAGRHRTGRGKLDKRRLRQELLTERV